MRFKLHSRSPLPQGVEVCHVGVQRYLRDSYDFDSMRVKQRRSSVI